MARAAAAAECRGFMFTLLERTKLSTPISQDPTPNAWLARELGVGSWALTTFVPFVLFVVFVF
jgi:hypothetical protein